MSIRMRRSSSSPTILVRDPLARDRVGTPTPARRLFDAPLDGEAGVGGRDDGRRDAARRKRRRRNPGGGHPIAPEGPGRAESIAGSEGGFVDLADATSVPAACGGRLRHVGRPRSAPLHVRTRRSQSRPTTNSASTSTAGSSTLTLLSHTASWSPRRPGGHAGRVSRRPRARPERTVAVVLVQARTRSRSRRAAWRGLRIFPESLWGEWVARGRRRRDRPVRSLESAHRPPGHRKQESRRAFSTLRLLLILPYSFSLAATAPYLPFGRGLFEPFRAADQIPNSRTTALRLDYSSLLPGLKVRLPLELAALAVTVVEIVATVTGSRDQPAHRRDLGDLAAERADDVVGLGLGDLAAGIRRANVHAELPKEASRAALR